MKADMTIYLDGALEARLPQITAHRSPLRLEKQVTDFYILYSRDTILDNSFVYGTSDSEIMSEYPVHIEAQKALGFQSESNLYYDGCDLNPEKIEAFRKIIEYLAAKDIPFYITARDEYGQEILIRGYNPLTGTGIQNPNFKQTLPGILE
jgi:hypothetical protein